MRAILAYLEPFVLLLLGTVALASILPPKGGMAAVLHVAADAGIALLFFLHGAKLSRQAILDGVRHWRLHGVTLAITYILFPLTGITLGALHMVQGPLATGLLFLSLLPSTVQSSIAFTALARGNVAAAVCSASFSNLAGIVVTPLLVLVLIDRAGPIGMAWDAAGTIVLQLLLPFVAGHLMRPLIGGFLARHKRLVGSVDRASILLVVYAAFGAAVLSGLWHHVAGIDLLLVGLVCAVQLATVLAVTWWAGRMLGFAAEDRIVLLFCGSKKSLASGVPMAGVLFPPHAVGTIILPLMLFHQLQLILCAMLARRLANRFPAATRDTATPLAVAGGVR